jgi:hypothetical protein
MPQTDSRQSLEPLPESTSKFWENAELHTDIIPRKVHTDDPHYFVRQSGHTAECTHCNWGFQLDWGDKIIDGHLFDKTGRRVI